MGTKISWAEETWSPVVGCTKCSPGCASCYALRMAYRLKRMGKSDYFSVVDKYRGKAGWTGKIKLRKNQLDKPLHWHKPRRIFVVSMGDLFHEAVPEAFIYEVLGVAGSTERHTFMFLTKRPKRMVEVYHRWQNWIEMSDAPDNMQFGVSISTQAEADEKIPIGLQIPGFDWVSIEPMLGEMDFREETITVGKSRRNRSKIAYPLLKQLKWVVIGAESIGGNAGRPCKLEWVRDVVRQCDAAGVGVHVKQLHIDGKLVKDIKKFPPDLRRRETVCQK